MMVRFVHISARANDTISSEWGYSSKEHVSRHYVRSDLQAIFIGIAKVKIYWCVEHSGLGVSSLPLDSTIRVRCRWMAAPRPRETWEFRLALDWIKIHRTLCLAHNQPSNQPTGSRIDDMWQMLTCLHRYRYRNTEGKRCIFAIFTFWILLASR